MINSINDHAVLNNGTEMPWLGFGVFKMEDGDEVERSIHRALELGYRSFDTAMIYRNERSTGRAIRHSGLSRNEVFLTTKVWNDDQRAGRVNAAFEESLERLGVDYVDLYLVHWPVRDCYVETWNEMVKIYRSGRAKAIGVSNFMIHHLEDILRETDVVPAVNQIEFHPRLMQPELLQFCRHTKIQIEAWSPLKQGQIVHEPAIVHIAEKCGKTSAQITLRWDIQHEVVTIPKSSRSDRIEENCDIFDFEISQDDMDTLDALDTGTRVGPDPETFDF